MGPNKSKVRNRPPGEGERAARRGYVHQDRSSARLIYEALANRTLMWVGLADRAAGVADDFVLGLDNVVVAHQFKRSLRPAAIGLTALLLGEGCAIAELATAYTCLRKQFPQLRMRLRYLTNDFPSKNDRLIKGDRHSNTAELIAECEAHPRRTLAEWRATRWKPVINELAQRSRLSDSDFESFWMNFDLVVGPRAVPAFDLSEDKSKQDQIEGLARALSTLVADNSQKDRWSRAELLEAVGWPDRFSLRFAHTFPVGAYVQRNEVTEGNLSKAISAYSSGYLSLVGPPGAGKSTLLQRAIRDQPHLRVVRYLAFVPGTAQGQGRGEADSFYDDVNCQLASANLELLRLKDDSTWARQQQFEHLLARASERHVLDGTRYIIVVDGLDHISREEHPDRSLLAALPLPQAVPDGVLFLLGTQRLDLEDMPTAVQQQAVEDGRRIDIAPLSELAVASMAETLGLPVEVDRQKLYDVTSGHPLVTRYLIEKLIVVEASERQSLLNGELGFGGDLQSVYDAAWRSVEQARDCTAVKQVLALIARVQGAIEPELLAKATSDEAVESVLREVGYLLDVSDGRWAMFHNSFRLFLHQKRVERFGKADPEFAPRALYRKLADLTALSSPNSPQR
ncbi:MAG: ATP-binding protein [Telmatospirillum sp.]|nr:ATP-binding protein [Telmatospirillum sp.]